MADSYYQTATTPKLYVSYPLYQYASGALDEYFSLNNSVSDEDMIKLLQIDPSNQVKILSDSTNDFVKYKIVPSFDEETLVQTSGLWNFDFCMLLGHNLASQNIKVNPVSWTSNNYTQWLNISTIVNHTNDSAPEYDGWSLISLDSIPADDHRGFGIYFENLGGNALDFNLNSILFGKTFTFPQNTTLSTTTEFEYGIKQKSTISGKTISQANWTKPNNWITEPFGLGSQVGDNFQRRSGRRSWKMSFDYLAPDKVMNQNMMMNSNGFTAQDNHSTASDGVESLYNINNSTDYFTSVIQRSMNNHLPMVLQIDKDDKSPSNFAVVRINNKSYQLKQKSPNLYSISVEFIEQI